MMLLAGCSAAAAAAGSCWCRTAVPQTALDCPSKWLLLLLAECCCVIQNGDGNSVRLHSSPAARTRTLLLLHWQGRLKDAPLSMTASITVITTTPLIAFC
jgi:hypothetical protein